MWVNKTSPLSPLFFPFPFPLGAGHSVAIGEIRVVPLLLLSFSIISVVFFLSLSVCIRDHRVS